MPISQDDPTSPEFTGEVGRAPEGLGEPAPDAAASARPPVERAFGAFLEHRKILAAQRIACLAKAVRAAADWLEREAPSICGAVRRRAFRVELKAHEIRDTSLAAMERDLGAKASQKPFALVGWGVLAGFLLARRFIPPSP